jgi:hypothetical protein
VSESDDEPVILPLEQRPVEVEPDSIRKQERRRADFKAKMALARMLRPELWRPNQEQDDELDIVVLRRTLEHARARRNGALGRWRNLEQMEHRSKGASQQDRCFIRKDLHRTWKLWHELKQIIVQLQARIVQMGEEVEGNEDDRPLIYLLAEPPGPSPPLSGAGSKRKSPATPAAATPPPSKVAKPSAAASPGTKP